jgi:hypothetical protein
LKIYASEAYPGSSVAKKLFFRYFSGQISVSCDLMRIIFLVAGGDELKQQQQVGIDTTIAYSRGWKRRNYHD